MKTTKTPIRTNRSEYAAGYEARRKALPIPGTVSRQWAKGYQAAWKAEMTGQADPARSEYGAGYKTRQEGSPVPPSVSREWAKGYRDAYGWRQVR